MAIMLMSEFITGEAKIMRVKIQFQPMMNSIKLLLYFGEYMIFRELRF